MLQFDSIACASSGFIHMSLSIIGAGSPPISPNLHTLAGISATINLACIYLTVLLGEGVNVAVAVPVAVAVAVAVPVFVGVGVGVEVGKNMVMVCALVQEELLLFTATVLVSWSSKLTTKPAEPVNVE